LNQEEGSFFGVSQEILQPFPTGEALPQPETGDRFCLFESMGARCAVPMAGIVQVLEVESFATVPLAPAHLCGVTFYENSVLPLVRLEGGSGAPEVCAVLQHGDTRFGLSIDGVLGFRGLVESRHARVDAIPAALERFVESHQLDGDVPVLVISLSRLVSELRPKGSGGLAS